MIDGQQRLEKDQLGKEEYVKKYNMQPNENAKKQREEKEKLGNCKFNEKYGTDEYASFRFFSARFEKVDRSSIEAEWNTVQEYYETFIEWYSNPLWYHYIGFLIYCGEPIRCSVGSEEIKIMVENVEIKSLKYTKEVSNKDCIKPFADNIEKMIEEKIKDSLLRNDE